MTLRRGVFHFLQAYGYPLIFLAVLAENLGLPLPSFALLLAAASMARELDFSLAGLIALAVLAALIGDAVWYVLGRQQGRPILRTLCSLSLNPDSCVSRTENLFSRHGLKSLLVAKFLPGLNTVAPPLAGMLKVSPLRFAAFDLAGTGLWAGSAAALGWAFRAQVMSLLNWLDAVGRMGLLVLAVLLSGWLVFKWAERRRFYRLLDRSRITAPELKGMLERGENVVVVDLRSDLTYAAEGLKIQGALHIPPREFERRYADIPAGRTVVMYCT
jgi:membrane protein DedA with SNARE-associated domain